MRGYTNQYTTYAFVVSSNERFTRIVEVGDETVTILEYPAVPITLLALKLTSAQYLPDRNELSTLADYDDIIETEVRYVSEHLRFLNSIRVVIGERVPETKTDPAFIKVKAYDPLSDNEVVESFIVSDSYSFAMTASLIVNPFTANGRPNE